jgi:LmbE family N-acetylglucosaminyl deacetylase
VRVVGRRLAHEGADARAGAASPGREAPDHRLRAHPDDTELREGGAAAKWAALGHHVKFVSCTNGDIGHWNMAGGPLAKRRAAEVKETGKILGITQECSTSTTASSW